MRKPLKRSKVRRKKKKADAGSQTRVLLLYGLSTLFLFVVGGLMLARPRPLVAMLPTPTSPLAATQSSPLDDALQTTASPKPWKQIRVKSQPVGAFTQDAHFTLRLDTTKGVEVLVGADWLQQRSSRPGELLLTVVGNVDANPMLNHAVDGLVKRLCDRFQIDPIHVYR